MPLFHLPVVPRWTTREALKAFNLLSSEATSEALAQCAQGSTISPPPKRRLPLGAVSLGAGVGPGRRPDWVGLWVGSRSDVAAGVGDFSGGALVELAV